MEFLLFVAGCLIFPSLHRCSLFVVSRRIAGRSKGLHYAISTRIVSLLQAVCATCVGLQVVLKCNDIMKERFKSVNNYAWFAVSYFYYDLGAMFLECYHSYPNDSLKSICQRFIAKKWLIVIHHIFLPLIGFPMIVFYRRGLGDFFVGCIYSAEMSTPFLSIHTLLQKLDMQRSVVYKVNAFLLAVSFFIGRILVFPFMYHSYAKYADIYIWQVPFRIPLHCNVSCLVLFALQLVWFIAIVRRVALFLKSVNWTALLYRKVDNVRCDNGTFTKNNNSQQTLNGTQFSNGKQR